MSLFGPVYVTSVLTLSRQQDKALRDVADGSQRSAAALEALVAKLNEPQDPGLTPEQQAQVHDLIAQLKTSGDALQAADAAQPPA
jgi:hypothetical protein